MLAVEQTRFFHAVGCLAVDDVASPSLPDGAHWP